MARSVDMALSTLNRKLLRDLGELKGQAAAIAVVIAAGVMTLILSATNLDSIRFSQERFYDEYRFADVFAQLKRAPERLSDRLRDVDGVDQVHTRVQAPLRLEVPGFDDPVRGRAVSIPDGGQPTVNRLYLREGTLPEPGSTNQVVISEAFAQAHDLHGGDPLSAIINGRLDTLIVSGVALSPEWVYTIGPGDLLPDYKRFAVLWMNRRALARAFDMDGAFNSVALTLQAGVAPEGVVDELDLVLEPYGGIGAHGRDEVVSHRFLSDEIDSLEVMAWVLPVIFLGVSAFLLNVLMGRIVRTQRQQVALLKAFGFTNGDIAWHYGLLTGLIVALGAVLGVVLGAWAGDAMAELYHEYYRFPELTFRLRARIVALGILVAGGAAMLGTFRAVSEAVALAPAEAMRPPVPETYRRSRLLDTRAGRWLSQTSRIIARNLGRHRLKALFSVLGISLSAALLLVGSYQFQAVDHLIDTQYRLVQKMDVVLTFSEPTSARATAELRHQPGVAFVEGFRNVPVRLIHGHRSYRTAIQGMEAEPDLRGLIDEHERPVQLPAEGLLLTDHLAAYLGLRVGDAVTAEIMEGHRDTVELPVAATVAEPVGVGAYMRRTALNRLMREGPAISGAWMLVDESRRDELYDALWDVPRVAGIGLMNEVESSIRSYIDDTLLATMGILLLLAGSIAFAVVYNNARIAFAERSRELATLRVLGFTRGEVAWVLIGEIAVLVLVSIPAGWLIGAVLAKWLTEAISTDLFRVPFIITPWVYAFSAAGVIVAATLSLLMIARRLHRLDMISALKVE